MPPCIRFVFSPSFYVWGWGAALALLWQPHQPSPYKAWYKLINLIRGCDCGCDYRGREGGGWLRWGCAGSQGPGDDEPRGAGEQPRRSAWLMREAAVLPPSNLLHHSPPSIYLGFLLFIFYLSFKHVSPPPFPSPEGNSGHFIIILDETMMHFQWIIRFVNFTPLLRHLLPLNK